MLVFLTAIAIGLVRTKDLFASTMLTGIYSLISAIFFVLMDAVDVAFTEAAVGAGISSLLILSTLKITGSHEKPENIQPRIALLMVSVTATLLLFGTIDMPAFGDPESPIQKHVAPHYLIDSSTEINIPNVVTSVLASYRGFDTFGETVVIFTAGIGVLALLGINRKPEKVFENNISPMHQHKILRIVSKMLIPLILLFALYVQFHGDYGPGGGFQAGVIFAAGIILHTMLFGLGNARRIFDESYIRVLSALGVLVYGSVGIISMLNGKHFLDYSALAHEPTHGQHIGIMLVELGVGMTVTSVMLIIFFTFAGRIDKHRGDEL